MSSGPYSSTSSSASSTSEHLISERLIAKYGANLPRYTSYPTAPWFSHEFDAHDFVEHAGKSNEGLLPRALSLYVHIPFCHSLCYFCGCNKVVAQPGADKVTTYIDALLFEIERKAALFDDDRLVQQIHFGGGTPNFLKAHQLEEILSHIAQCFHLDLPSKLEVGIELDPRYLNAEDVGSLAAIGFNRFSVGVQDFSATVQEAINRQQDERKTLSIIDAARRHSSSVNVDIITGLPEQTEASVLETISKITDSGASRIAAYGFAYLPERIKAQRLINAKRVPDDAKRLRLNHVVSDALLQQGYKHIGMDHYTLPEDSLYQALQRGTLQRNFQGYTTHAKTDLVGVGVSAISNLESAFAQNTTTISDYVARVNQGQLPIARGIELSADDLLRQHMIQELMCGGRIDLQQSAEDIVPNLSDQPLTHYFASITPQLDGFVADQILTKTARGFALTDLGRFFMRPVAALFDAYLTGDSGMPQKVTKFSRAL